MTLAKRLDRALAWLLVEWEPRPWQALALFLLGLAVVGHWDVM